MKDDRELTHRADPVIGNSFTDSTGTNGTQYFYLLTAVSSLGESVYSLEASADSDGSNDMGGANGTSGANGTAGSGGSGGTTGATGPSSPNWIAVPCDADGTPNPALARDYYGFYPLTGFKSGSASNTYPAAMTNAAMADPADFWFYLNMDRTYFPIPLSPLDNNGFDGAGGYLYHNTTTPDNVIRFESYDSGIVARNYGSNNYGIVTTYYVYPTLAAPDLPRVSGPINGSVTAHVLGRLQVAFKCVWNGPAPQPAYPAHLNFLLHTQLSASAGFNNSSVWALLAPLTASANAADGQGDSVTAITPTLLSPNPPPQTAEGHHLLSVPVDSNGMAIVHLAGTIDGAADNEVSNQTYGQVTASSNASITAGATQDNRAVILHRDGAHNETQDSTGTVHGATTYSYASSAGGLGNSTDENIQCFHPYFAGTWSLNPNYVSGGPLPVFNISWQWSPANLNDANAYLDDTWSSHNAHIPFGSLNLSSTNEWVGPPDSVQHISTQYTAQDLGDHATATAIYDLAVHDKYDNFRRVDKNGNPLGQFDPAELGTLNQIGQSNAVPMPGQPNVTYDLDAEPVNWDAAGDVGGGLMSATAAYLLAAYPPTYPILVVGLAGTALSTVSSYPSQLQSVGSPDAMTATFLQQAYQTYIYDQTAYPGEQITTNTVSIAFAQLLAQNPDFAGYLGGIKYGMVTVTATLDVQMLNYYFYCDQYDSGGLVSTTFPSTVVKSGGLIWNYLWNGPSPVTSPPNPNGGNNPAG